MAYTEEDRAALAHAAGGAGSDRRRHFAANVRRIVRVDGRPAPAEAVESASYGKEDGIAVVAEVGFAPSARNDFASQRVVGRGLTISWALASGRTLPGFRGTIVHAKDGLVTAATGGHEAADTPLGRGPEDDREYAGVEPSSVLYEALLMLEGGYEGIDIPRRKGPKVNRRGTEALRWTQSVLDVVGVVEEAGLVAADLPTNVASAYPDGPVSEKGATDWTFEEGIDTLTDGISVETAQTQVYSAVIVWRNNRGTHEPLTKPIPIDNRSPGSDRGASVLPVELTEDVAAMGVTPYEFGLSEAERLGHNDVRVTVSAVYPCFFLARGDSVTAIKREALGDGSTLVSTYRVRLDSVPIEGKTSSASGPASLVSERVARPQRALERQVRSPFVAAMWGRESDGVPFLDGRLPWVFYREDAEGPYVLVDTEEAHEYGVEIYRDPDVLNGSVLVITDEPTQRELELAQELRGE